MNLLPSFDEIYSDKRGHRYMYYQFHIALDTLAKKTASVLRPIVETGKNDALVDSVIDEFKRRHVTLLELFITDYAGWSSITTISEKEPVRNLEDLEQRLKQMDIEKSTSSIFRHNVSSDLFVELSRIHFIVMYKMLLGESATIARLGEIPKDTSKFKVLWSPVQHSTYFTDAPQAGPIMSYKQSEIMALLLKLTERINFLPIDAVDEVKQMMLLLYTRNSIFFCERMKSDIIDSMRTENGEPTRNYMTFCSIYFHAIQRRIFYYDSCVRVKLSGCGAKSPPTGGFGTTFHPLALQYFVERDIKIGSENFEEDYAKACEEGYSFPGDLEWFKFNHPDIPPQTGPMLDCFRKDLAKQFYTNYRVSQEVVMSAAQQSSHSGHASRIFIFNLFDQYMRIHYKIPWKDAVLITNSALSKSENEKKLFSKKSAPLLVQVFSKFWVYYDKKVYMTDDIYEAISYWMYLLKVNCGGKLFGVDLNELIFKIWGRDG